MTQRVTFDEAKEALRSFRKLESNDQRRRVREIEQAFRVFWEGNPTEDEFNDCVQGLIVSARMLYWMIKR